MVGCDPGLGPGTDYPEIRNWHDLHAIRYNLDGHYVLMNDLNSTSAGYTELAGHAANQGKGWQPIGTSDYRFTGSFDGRGYEIRDVFINRPDESMVGLFGAVDEEGVVQNIGVVNAMVTGEWAVGGLVGGNWGYVTNSYSDGNVSGDDYVGGLVGGNAGDVSYSYSTVTVIGRWDVGGLVGASDSQGTVSSSYSDGSVTGEWAVGGLMGGNLGGTVSSCYSISSATGDDYVGGLVGDNQGIVHNSYATGSVTGEWHVGGLVGYSQGNISNSYSIGSVTGSIWVGGLVGTNRDGTVSNSFWDIATSGMEESDGGMSKTTAEMRDITTFSGAGWDVTAVTPGAADPAYTWNIVAQETYPFLSWQSV
ncbi:MAG: GLUG motif-containing protein [Chloroflexota bacterium]